MGGALHTANGLNSPDSANLSRGHGRRSKRGDREGGSGVCIPPGIMAVSPSWFQPERSWKRQ